MSLFLSPLFPSPLSCLWRLRPGGGSGECVCRDMSSRCFLFFVLSYLGRARGRLLDVRVWPWTWTCERGRADVMWCSRMDFPVDADGLLPAVLVIACLARVVVPCRLVVPYFLTLPIWCLAGPMTCLVWFSYLEPGRTLLMAQRGTPCASIPFHPFFASGRCTDIVLVIGGWCGGI